MRDRTRLTRVQKLVGRKFQKYMSFIVKQYIPTYKIYTSVIPLTILSTSTGVGKTLFADCDVDFGLTCWVSSGCFASLADRFRQKWQKTCSLRSLPYCHSKYRGWSFSQSFKKFFNPCSNTDQLHKIVLDRLRARAKRIRSILSLSSSSCAWGGIDSRNLISTAINTPFFKFYWLIRLTLLPVSVPRIKQLG